MSTQQTPCCRQIWRSLGSEVERGAQNPLLLFPIPSCPLRSAANTARHSTQGTGALPGSPETQPRPTVPTELQGKRHKPAARNQNGEGPFTGDHYKLLPFEEEPSKPQPPHHSRLLQDTCRKKEDSPIRFLSKNKSNFHRQRVQPLCTSNKVTVCGCMGMEA